MGGERGEVGGLDMYGTLLCGVALDGLLVVSKADRGEKGRRGVVEKEEGVCYGGIGCRSVVRGLL